MPMTQVLAQRGQGTEDTASRPHTPSQRWLTRVDFWWLLCAALLAVVLRALWIAYLNVDPNDGRFDDSVFYHNAARLISEGFGFVNPYNGNPTAHRPPVYPLFLAAVYRVFGWDPLVAKVLNIALAVGTLILVYLLCRRLFSGRRAAIFAAFIFAAFPGQVYFATLVYAETLFAAVFTLVLFLALIWATDGVAKWWQVVLLGVLVGIATLVRVEGIWLIVVLAVAWALTVRPWRVMLRYGALLMLGIAVVLVPWTVRNAVQLHQFVPLRERAASAIARAFDPNATGVGGVGPREERQGIIEGLRFQLTHPLDVPPSVIEKWRALYENDSDGIRLATHPYPIPGYVRPAIRAVYDERLQVEPPPAWFTDDYQPLRRRSQLAFWERLANRYFFAAGAAALLGAASALLRRERHPPLLIVAALLWTLPFGFIFPVSRYHFPLGPVISVYAGIFLALVWDMVAGAGRVVAARARALAR